ncbi:hypothetical protein EMIT0P291_40254 [Pseudomonas sp. IT-P291]
MKGERHRKVPFSFVPDPPPPGGGLTKRPCQTASFSSRTNICQKRWSLSWLTACGTEILFVGAFEIIMYVIRQGRVEVFGKHQFNFHCSYTLVTGFSITQTLSSQRIKVFYGFGKAVTVHFRSRINIVIQQLEAQPLDVRAPSTIGGVQTSPLMVRCA